MQQDIGGPLLMCSTPFGIRDSGSPLLHGADYHGKMMLCAGTWHDRSVAVSHLVEVHGKRQCNHALGAACTQLLRKCTQAIHLKVVFVRAGLDRSSPLVGACGKPLQNGETGRWLVPVLRFATGFNSASAAGAEMHHQEIVFTVKDLLQFPA